MYGISSRPSQNEHWIINNPSTAISTRKQFSQLKTWNYWLYCGSITDPEKHAWRQLDDVKLLGPEIVEMTIEEDNQIKTK